MYSEILISKTYEFVYLSIKYFVKLRYRLLIHFYIEFIQETY